MPSTLRSMRAEITKWLRGDLQDDDGQSQINDAISDAIESIWGSMMQVQLARFFGASSPVTFTLAQGAERVQLVTIADPTVAPTVGFIAGAALPARTYEVSYTYVTESGSQTLPSPITSQLIAGATLAQINAPPSVPNAIGWNCYVGQQEQALQNQQPLPFGPKYTEPVTGFQDYPVFQQVPPIVNSTADDLAYIQHMEIITNNVKIAWNESRIDDEMMRRLAATQPSSSQWGAYVWQLSNGTTLEFRPVAGTGFTPRYWYIARPRRLRYDQAEVPYQSIDGVHEFIRCYAMAALKLSLEEYLAQTAWEAKADKKRSEIVLALTQENWNVGNRITPYLCLIL